MKSYPSIDTQWDPRQSYLLFDKLDGSNLRAEWSPKKGWYKFGSRTQLLTPDQAILWPAVSLIEGALGQNIAARLAAKRAERAVVFFEYAGPNSFAGSHPDPAADRRLSIIDIALNQKGLLPPEELLRWTEGLPTPAVLHEGRVTQDLIDRIRADDLPGITLEGVVGKSLGARRDAEIHRFKAKTQRWLDRLRTSCGADQALFERLA